MCDENINAFEVRTLAYRANTEYARATFRIQVNYSQLPILDKKKHGRFQEKIKHNFKQPDRCHVAKLFSRS